MAYYVAEHTDDPDIEPVRFKNLEGVRKFLRAQARIWMGPIKGRPQDAEEKAEFKAELDYIKRLKTFQDFATAMYENYGWRLEREGPVFWEDL